MKLKVNLTLKSGSGAEAPVIAIINFGYKEFDVLKQTYIYKPLRYYTGVKVDPKNWDAQTKLPKDRNQQLELIRIVKQINDTFTYLNVKQKVSNDLLKAELDEHIKGKESVAKRVRIVDFIDTEIMKLTTLTEGSKALYRNVAKKLSDFETKIGKPIYSNEFDERMYQQFIEEMRGIVNTNNALWSIYKTLKATLKRIAKTYKIEVFNPSMELNAVDKISKVTEDKTYLNFEQIKCIMDHEPSTEKLRNVKLMLLTLLFTGCRISDIGKIKPEHTYTKNGISFTYARYISQKTETEIISPILKPLMDAIEQNGGKMAYPISPEKFNKYVKELLEECGMDEEITLSYTDSRGRKKFSTRRLCDLVSSHIGRRSFITNLINYIPITILSKITGHEFADNSIIFSYNKISLLDNAAQFVKDLRRAVDENQDHFLFEL